MRKKDYIVSAKVIRAYRFGLPESQRTEVDRALIVPLAQLLKIENAAFDYSLFLAACGTKATEAPDDSK